MIALAAAGALAGLGAAPAPVPPRYAQLTVRRQIVVRISREARVPAATPLRWKESRGPRCIAMADMAGAAVVEEDSVDLILRGGRRVRAEFEDSCLGLAFYGGFYVRPTADGRVCADRDGVNDRSGNECEITRFRTLAPQDPAPRRGLIDRITGRRRGD